ncbi:hypothetical protein [Parabacteroides sp. FAFU027]|uniref:hypothetical protein n=1 Tax=Parabacteroides sp. FAFU027 TaxID=2922715 RepID=UPI001FAF41C2|nr:hypothetical protein [Parabacteroides sp. FAFU027]
MQAILLDTDSKSDLKLLMEIAKKIGIKAKTLSEADMEDLGLVHAIKAAKTDEYVDTDSFLKKLRK